MLTTYVAQIMERDLIKLQEELSAYANEADMWKLDGTIANSAGNLALHLLGNLNHFIGATLGNTGYIRERDLEFSSKDIPREKILLDIDTLKVVLATTLPTVDNNKLDEIYPFKLSNGKEMTVGYFLLHLTDHLGYHLGQINYHRRLLAS